MDGGLTIHATMTRLTLRSIQFFPSFTLGTAPAVRLPRGWQSTLETRSRPGRIIYSCLLTTTGRFTTSCWMSLRTTVQDVHIVQEVKANIKVLNGPDGALYFIEQGGKEDGILKRIVAAPETSTPTMTASETPVPTSTATPVPTAVITLPGDGSKTFSETEQTVSGIFLAYWQQHGGLIQQGFPISAPMSELSSLDGKTYAVQYFERAAFEYHPEIEDPSYKVLLSQLGTFRYKQRYRNSPPSQAASTSPDAILFPETGMHLGGRFLAYWQQHGGLLQQGFPISEEFTEVSPLNDKPYTVQYFERAVLEYHPENAGTQYEVLLSQLGTFQYAMRYGQ